MTYRTYINLETEPDLSVNAAVVSDVAHAKPTEGRRERRLSEQLRSQISDRVAEVRVIQNVVEVQRERQVVTAATGTTAAAEATGTAAAWTTKSTTAAATWSTSWTTTAGHAATHDRALAAVIALTILPVLIVGIRAGFRSKRPRLADAQVNRRRTRTFSKVARNHHVARIERQFEVAEWSALDIDVGAVRTRRR